MDTPRSFQTIIDATGTSVSYSELRRQAQRNRAEYSRNLKDVHRERSCELMDLADRVSPRVDDRLSAETLQAEEAWQKFHSAMRRADFEDVEQHRQRLSNLVQNVEPRISDKLETSTEQHRSKYAQERENALMNEATIRLEYERSLEKLMLNARPRVEERLSDATNDVRQRLAALRERMRSHDAEVCRLQQGAIEELRQSTGNKVNSWQSAEVMQLQQYFQMRNDEARDARAEAMQAYYHELQEIADYAPARVDCYIDEEVKASRRLPIDLEKKEVAKLQRELAAWHAGKASKEESHRCVEGVRRLQSMPWSSPSHDGPSRASKLDGTAKAVRRHVSALSNGSLTQAVANPVQLSFQQATDIAGESVARLPSAPSSASKNDLSFSEVTISTAAGTSPSSSCMNSVSLWPESPSYGTHQRLQNTVPPKARMEVCTPRTSMGSSCAESPWRSTFTPAPRTSNLQSPFRTADAMRAHSASAPVHNPQTPTRAYSAVAPVHGPCTPRDAIIPNNMVSPSKPVMQHSYTPAAQAPVESVAVQVPPLPSRCDAGSSAAQVMVRRRGGMNTCAPQPSLTARGPQAAMQATSPQGLVWPQAASMAMVTLAEPSRQC